MTAVEKKAQDDNTELWKRLDELELEEGKDIQEIVKLQEQLEEETVLTADHKQAVTNIINISHTSLPAAVANTTSNRTHMPSSGIINSPADICVKKSSVNSAEHIEELAVKSKSVHWPSDVTSTPESHTDVPAIHVPKPFTGSVVEKSSSTAVSTVSELIPVFLN